MAYDTAGSMLHVDYNHFNHPYLTQLTWKAEIAEYNYIPAGLESFRPRIEFNSVGFGGSVGICYVGAMIQNLGHSFTDDAVGSSGPFPAVGLYLTSLHPEWPDSFHGVSLNADPALPPRYGRIFENVDGLGYSAKNIYTRQNIGDPPVVIRWTVSKLGTITNPPANLSKNLAGTWVPLIGTFAVHQEYFGAADRILDAQKGTVRYTDMRAFDGTEWYDLQDWKITWRIDDEAGNLDNRFGWKTDGFSLISRVGHEADIAECYRDPGRTFRIMLHSDATAFYTVTPCRVADTRNPVGPSGAPALGANTSRIFPVSGLCGIPSSAHAVSVNVTAVQAAAAGYLTLYPGNATGAPLVSSVNFSSGQIRGNNAVVVLATDGTGSIRVKNGSAGSVHFILDVNGYFQ
jgi:hypothetical protein